MKRIIHVILLLALALSTTSCFTMMALAAASSDESKNQLGYEWMETSVKTFQRVAAYAALATTSSGDVICVVADFGEYYDGLIKDGFFKKKGTYSYITTSGANKTVLVYVYKKDLKKLENYADELQKKKESVVIDDSNKNHVEI